MTSNDKLSLADGKSVCNDFSIAREFDSARRVAALRELLDTTEDDLDHVSRAWLNERLSGRPLSQREASSLFTCLLKNEAATQSKSAATFADYEFAIKPIAARRVLDQQIVAIQSCDAIEQDIGSDSVFNFAATFPTGYTPKGAVAREVPEIERLVRSEVFDAVDSVRIANPYFDPNVELLDDIASLPQRGVETKILTRETNEAGDDLRESLNRLWERLSADQRDLLEIRNLYKFDSEREAQHYATHAKLIIVDEASCYVGSANLTAHSLSRNFEFGVFVVREEVGTATDVFDEVFAFADEVELPLS